jgi:hypothetical protein
MVNTLYVWLTGGTGPPMDLQLCSPAALGPAGGRSEM